ncbi:MAG: hypothetical protein WBQ11_17335, partial [Isosphaeraceae bacterium]
MLPVKAGKDDLQARREGPGGNQAAARGRAGCDQQVNRRGDRGQPERPASRPPPDEIRCRAERQGELTRRIRIAGQPPNQARRCPWLGQGVGRQRATILHDVFVGRGSSALGQQDAGGQANGKHQPQPQGDDVADPLSPSWPLVVRGISPAPQGQGGEVNHRGEEGHLLDQRGRTQANPGRNVWPAAKAAPCQDQECQRRYREQVHEMFHVRSITEQVGIGAEHD